MISAFVYYLQIWCITKKGPLFVASFSPLLLLVVGIFGICFRRATSVRKVSKQHNFQIPDIAVSYDSKEVNMYPNSQPDWCTSHHCGSILRIVGKESR